MLRRVLHSPPLSKAFSTLVLSTSSITMQHSRSPASSVANAPPSKRKRQTKKPSTSGASTPQFMSTSARVQIAPSQVNEIPANSEAPAGRGFTEIRFNDFLENGSLSAATAQGIKFEFCTPVQAATLPVILSGADVYVSASLFV